MAREQKLDPRFANLLYIIVFLAVVIGMVCYISADRKAQEEKALAYEQEQRAIRQQQELLRQEKMANSSFYQKLAEGFDVNVLIVGDSIGFGTGSSAENKRWPQMLCAQLEKQYGVNTTLTNVSMGGTTSYAGYVRTMMLDDGLDYDLVAICFGHNDKTAHFSLYYETMLRAIKSRYPKASLIAVMESSQREYTEKMMVIQSLAEHYDFQVVDTIAPFQDRYDDLVADGVHPNDAGYKVYFEQVYKTVEAQVAAYRGYDRTDIPIINEATTTFDTFRWYDKEMFVREGNTFILPLKASASVLGVYYRIYPPNTHFKLYIDQVEYAAVEDIIDWDFSQHTIEIVNDWMNGERVEVQEEIRIVFGEDEEGTKHADGFRGIALSGL